MAIDPAEVAALAAAAFAGSVIFGVTGFGAALVTVPFATHFVPLPFALAVFVLQDLSSAVRVATESPRNAVKAEVVRMVPTMIVGIVLGATLLVSLPRKANMLALGTFVVLYGIWSLIRRGVPSRAARGWAYLAGFCGGIFGMLFGAGGPPYAIYLSHRDLTKEQFRATLSVTSVFSIGVRALALAVTGLLLRVDVWLTAAFVVPTALIGVALASRAFRRVSRELLLRLVALMLLATGVSLIARAVG